MAKYKVGTILRGLSGNIYRIMDVDPLHYTVDKIWSEIDGSASSTRVRWDHDHAEGFMFTVLSDGHSKDITPARTLTPGQGLAGAGARLDDENVFVVKGDVLRSKHGNIVVVASHTGNGFYRAIDLADGYVYERLADQEGNLEEHWNHLEWEKLFNVYESVSASKGSDV